MLDPDPCASEICVTCSDAAQQGRVVQILHSSIAIVSMPSGLEEVDLALVEAGIGDTVLVHAGVAIRRIP